MARDEALVKGLFMKVEPGKKYVFLVFGRLTEFTYTTENLPWGGIVFNIPLVYEIQYFKLEWNQIITKELQRSRQFTEIEMFKHPSHRQVGRLNSKQFYFNTTEYQQCLVKFQSPEKIQLYFVFNYTVQIKNSLIIRELFPSGNFFTQLENVLVMEIQEGMKDTPYYTNDINADELRAETFSSPGKKKILDDARKKVNEYIVTLQESRNRGSEPCCTIAGITREPISPIDDEDRVVKQILDNQVSNLAKTDAENKAEALKTTGTAETEILKKKLEVENNAEVKKTKEINETDVLKADALNEQDITKQKAIINAKKEADIQLIQKEAESETQRIKNLFDICKDPGTVADIERYNNIGNMKNLTTLVVGSSTSDDKNLERLAALKILEDKIQNKKGDEPPTDTKK